MVDELALPILTTPQNHNKYASRRTGLRDKGFVMKYKLNTS
jgi:hypothetical protein